MVFIHCIRILSSVTMSTCDVLLLHFRKMLLYTQGYMVAYSHLLSTLVHIYTQKSSKHYNQLCLGHHQHATNMYNFMKKTFHRRDSE